MFTLLSMINKQFFSRKLFMIICFIMIIILLFFLHDEYPFSCAQIKELQNEIAIEKKINSVTKNDSFIILNRQPDYLEQSTREYMKIHHINPLEKKANSVKSNKIQTKKKILSFSDQAPPKNFDFIWPIDKDKFWLSSYFGPRKCMNNSGGFHHGIDMAAMKGTKVKSVREGIVVEVGFQKGYGNTVLIEHTSNIKTRYAHLHTLSVRRGQKVHQGTIVGTVGETGSIRKKSKDGSHLHFEVYEQGKRINPLHCLPRVV